jgi:pyrroloquinoline quinone biosynthesis protein B
MSDATLRVLGVAQDGGVPHVACDCPRCARAREDPAAAFHPVSHLVESGGESLLLDAPPGVGRRLDALPDAVAVSHAHLGHLPGLLSFGPEAGDADALPAYGTPGLCALLRGNEPFASLVGSALDPRPVDPGDSVDVGEVSVTFRPVPHRQRVDTGTCAFVVDGPDRRVVVATDVDAWDDPTLDVVRGADAALLDGTFHDGDELPRMADVPHPPVVESVRRLADDAVDVRFSHLNHTNPLLDPDSPERRALESRGFAVAERGDVLPL